MRNKLGQMIKGSTSPAKGKHWKWKHKFTKEHLKKLSESHKGPRPWAIGRKHTEEAKHKISLHSWMKGRKGEKVHNYKGEKVSYTGLHQWVRRELGSPNKCEECGLSEIPKGMKRYFQWANVSREYKRDLSDWIRLCCKCHAKYDNNYAHLNKKHD